MAANLSQALVALLTGLASLFTFTTPISIYAQGEQPQIVVVEQGAVPDFPSTVEFTLKARGFPAHRAVLSYRLEGSDITIEVPAEIDEPGDDVDLTVTLDLSTHYIPPGSQVTYFWTLTDSAGRSASTPVETFQLVDDYYPWQSLTDTEGRVSVHWYLGGDEFGKNLLSTATSALDRLERDVGSNLEQQATIWVYATQDHFMGALPPDLPVWAGAKAFPELSLVIASISPMVMGAEEMERVVPHELSHLVFYQATRNARDPESMPPAWLDEGLAVYNQGSRAPEEEAALKQAAEEGLLVPLQALSGSFGHEEEEAVLAYAQSRSIVEFVLKDKRYGPEKLARTVSGFRNGDGVDQALQKGLGVILGDLERQWRSSLPYRVSAYAGSPGAQPSGSSGADPDLPWTIAYIALGIFAVMFVFGGVLTAVLLSRDRSL